MDTQKPRWDDPERLKEYKRAYHEANKEKIHAYQKAYRQANLEKLRQQDREYAAAHRDEAKERARKWREKNMDRADASRKTWYQSNREKIREYNKAYREANKEKLKAYEAARYEARRDYMRQWLRDNPEKNREQQHRRRAQMQNAPYEKIDRDLLYDMHQGICGLCNQPVSREEFTIDHIIPVAKGGGHVWGNLHIAHFSCNASKKDKRPDILYSM